MSTPSNAPISLAKRSREGTPSDVSMDTPVASTSSQTSVISSPPSKRFRKNGKNAVEDSDDETVGPSSKNGKTNPLARTERWTKIFRTIENKVVSIHFCQTRSFDGESTLNSEASGFVVDAKRGLILTNRHVAGTGPWWGYASFHTERADVRVAFRDPVHDFAFLKFNPKDLKYTEIESLNLNPDGARVGTEIRLIGNDGGCKLNFLTGEISRVDCNAPPYDDLTTRDYNSFYLQVGAGAVGGSSGSPVIDINGDAVAIQAGGASYQSTNYLFPLDQPLRALKLLQAEHDREEAEKKEEEAAKETEAADKEHADKDEDEDEDDGEDEDDDESDDESHISDDDAETSDISLDAENNKTQNVVPRGTIQVNWMHTPFDECRQLGLDDGYEKMLRKHRFNPRLPKSKQNRITGLLTASLVLRGGPAENRIKPGDILLKINDKTVTHFLAYEDFLDSNVGKEITIEVLRGGKPEKFTIMVDNLHSFCPHKYVAFSGASFQDLPFQIANAYNIPACTGGVYVASVGGPWKFEGPPDSILLTGIDEHTINNKADFIKAVKDLPDRARIAVRYTHVFDTHVTKTAIINIDRHWTPDMREMTRDDSTGFWNPRTISKAIQAKPREVLPGRFVEMEGRPKPGIAKLVRSFVQVAFRQPFRPDGSPTQRSNGMGCVVDAEKGYVVVSRSIVDNDVGDVLLTFANTIVVDARTVFLHPLYSFAILQYDTSLVTKLDIQAVNLLNQPVNQGDEVYFFGYNNNNNPVYTKTEVTSISNLSIDATSSPKFRAMNIEGISISTPLVAECGSGVLVTEEGDIRALWMGYAVPGFFGMSRETRFGMDPRPIIPILEKLREGEQPVIHMIGFEARTVQLSQAQVMGVPAEYLERVATESPSHQNLILVHKIDAGATPGLEEGDIILTLDSQLITRMSHLDCQFDKPTMKAVVVRRKELQEDVTVTTRVASELDVTQVVSFCGALLQRPHLAVRQQIKKLPSEVYVTYNTKGSPAAMYDLEGTKFITHVNDVETQDLDAFLRETDKIPDNIFFRLRMVTFDNVDEVVKIRKCDRYFPTTEYRRTDLDLNSTDITAQRWKEVVHKSAKKSNDEVVHDRIAISDHDSSTSDGESSDDDSNDVEEEEVSANE